MYKNIEGGICAPKGFKAAGVHCGIKKSSKKKDLALIYCEKVCEAAALYTQNKVKGAPLLVTKRNIEDYKAQAVIVNSGNANTCNADGEQKAQMMCELVANELKIKKEDVIVASTGVIGQVLPIEPIEAKIPELVSLLNENGSDDAAISIMTTDTVKKEIAISFNIGGVECKMGAIAKGSGMIEPNMATMLCFITTDVNIKGELLRKALLDVTGNTFNMVSVDGDTSTNDMVSVMASGLAENAEIIAENEAYDEFVSALNFVCTYVAKMLARDGEGATKLVECKVINAPDERTAKVVAKSVITSNLLKAAMFAADANWGRILCAIGYSDAEFDINKIDVTLKSEKGEVPVCKNGAGVEFSEEKAKEVLLLDEITILVDMQSGENTATAWGCDLTYDYVKMNADYRT
ncbi:MAG: bifunctional ornithine acetyltransferase/N-acetylglutamate synthase [Oscillospiraceae bacterium]|nr:bifunctional ornithine acetyltransferase/N-acetylglutamate synthase [Oscillospiraceae bacterium]